MLVFDNAMLYNASDSDVHKIAKDMKKRAEVKLQQAREAIWAHAEAADKNEISRLRQKELEELEASVLRKLKEGSKALPLEEERAIMRDLLQKLWDHRCGSLFHSSVDPEQFPDYYEQIKNPLSFTNVKQRIAETDAE
jgi:hypothetical protein